MDQATSCSSGAATRFERGFVEALIETPEHYIDRNIALAVYESDDLRQWASDRRDQVKKDNHLPRDVDCYEDWPELQPGWLYLDIPIGTRGLALKNDISWWKIVEDPDLATIGRVKGDTSHTITLCRPYAPNWLALTDADREKLKAVSSVLFEHANQSDDGSVSLEFLRNALIENRQ